jgi:hypothetical protein
MNAFILSWFGVTFNPIAVAVAISFAIIHATWIARRSAAAQKPAARSRRLSRQLPCMSVLIWCASFSIPSVS